MNKPRFLFLAGMILLAAASRLIPHPPNFGPIAALALFGGAQFADKRLAFLVPLAAMFLSDLVLGLHSLIPVIYGSFALIVCLGFWLRRRQNVWPSAVRRCRRATIFCPDQFRRLGDGANVSQNARWLGGLLCCRHSVLPKYVVEQSVLCSVVVWRTGHCGKSFC